MKSVFCRFFFLSKKTMNSNKQKIACGPPAFFKETRILELKSKIFEISWKFVKKPGIASNVTKKGVFRRFDAGISQWKWDKCHFWNIRSSHGPEYRIGSTFLDFGLIGWISIIKVREIYNYEHENNNKMIWISLNVQVGVKGLGAFWQIPIWWRTFHWIHVFFPIYHRGDDS